MRTSTRMIVPSFYLEFSQFCKGMTLCVATVQQIWKVASALQVRSRVTIVTSSSSSLLDQIFRCCGCVDFSAFYLRVSVRCFVCGMVTSQ